MTRTPVPADRRIAYGPDPNHFIDVYEPASTAKGVAMMIHGGFWRSKFDLTPASHLCSALREAGFLCANLEYRRTGETGGGWPTTFEDVSIGFAAVRERFRQYGNPVVLGHSAGGHLALLLAANTREIRGVVALGAVSCLEMAYWENLGSGAAEEFMGGSPHALPEFYAAADPVQHKSAVPRSLVHGAKDDIVPLSFSARFCVARHQDSGPVTLVEILDADHFDVIDPRSHAWPVVLSCVEGMLL